MRLETNWVLPDGVSLATSLLLLLLTGCASHAKGVVVPVVIPPQVDFGDHIKEIKVVTFEGIHDCARRLQTKIDSLATNAQLFRISTPGLEEPTETLEIRASVDTCAVKMGTGNLSAVFSVWHMGNQLRRDVVNEETNRPGASAEEVRNVLVDRVSAEYAKVIFPTSKKELRVFSPLSENDPGIAAAMNGNWGLAIEMWSIRIKESPAEPRAFYNRGIAYEAGGELSLAIKDYQKAVELRSDDLYVQALARAEGAWKARKHIEVLKTKLAGGS